jgi:hypothetical protein
MTNPRQANCSLGVRRPPVYEFEVLSHLHPLRCEPVWDAICLVMGLGSYRVYRHMADADEEAAALIQVCTSEPWTRRTGADCLRARRPCVLHTGSARHRLEADVLLVPAPVQG